MFTWQTYRSIAKAILTKRSPYYIQFYINGRCDLMCRQCNIVETNSRIPEMDLDQFRYAARNLRRIGVGIVLLTGGEPFLRKDLPEIVEIFISEGMNVRLQTAGLKAATLDMLRACYDAGARDINVSLDSLDFNASDYINAVPGSGGKVIETIERISGVFRSKSAILSFGTVLSALNYREIPAILEFAKRIGWYMSLVPVHISRDVEPRGFSSFDQTFVFNESLWSDLDDLANKLIQMKSSGYPLFDSESFITSSVAFLKGEAPKWRHKGKCDSPNLYFSVRPNGDFTTCCDYTLRNAPKIFDDNFVHLYKSGSIERRNDVRRIVDNCGGCHYGSYPEVTLSVRDKRALYERVKLVLTSGSGGLVTAPVKSDFVGEITSIKSNHPSIYPIAQWQNSEHSSIIEDWVTPGSRKTLLKGDRKRRQEEGRVRGKGSDVIIDVTCK